MSGPSPVFALIIPVLAIALPMAFAFWQAARKRELEHIERIKALEMGRPLPGHRAWNGALCAAVAAGVPLAALGAGLVATMFGPFSRGSEFERMQMLHSHGMGYYYAVWTCVAVVGVAGVVCGSVLSVLMLGKAEKTPGHATTEGKFRLDPDAYDTVGTRG